VACGFWFDFGEYEGGDDCGDDFEFYFGEVECRVFVCDCYVCAGCEFVVFV